MEGSLCTMEGQECLPDESGCGLYSGVRCSAGVWVFFEAGTGQCTGGPTDGNDTEAPTVACGETLPPEGTMCDEDGADCAPGEDLCAGYAGATCIAGRWKRYAKPAGSPEDCDMTLDCDEICAATLAAGCPAGPADGAACASECAARAASPCGPEFSTAITCGGEPLSFTCDAADRPTVASCEGEFAAFYQCIG